MTKMRKMAQRTRDRGASAVEYGLMVAAIAAVIVGVVFALGKVVASNFSSVTGQLSSNSAPAIPAPQSS